MPTEDHDTSMPNRCPTCDRPFDTLAGMRQHHTKVHDEPLPNRECERCGTEFYDPDSAHIYCEDCYDTDTKSDRWTHGNTDAECIECGQQFLYYPSEKRGLYCPDCVADESVSCTPSRPDASGRVTVTCRYCGSEFSAVRSRAEANEDLYCDRACYRAGLSADRRARGTWGGDDNPQWQGGIDTADHYGPAWNRQRRRALERDDHTCQRCGVNADKMAAPPEVHHKEPVRTFDDPTDAHTLSNLVTLCRPCHRAVEYQGATLDESE